MQLLNFSWSILNHQKSGTIINISSVLGETYGPLAGWYLSSKHALEGWSDALRVELKEFDIDVVIVQPGAINTNFFNVSNTSFCQSLKNCSEFLR